jgi:hypothetical protein
MFKVYDQRKGAQREQMKMIALKSLNGNLAGSDFQGLQMILIPRTAPSILRVEPSRI